MAELRPYPLGALVTRMFHELEAHQSVFDLPARRFVTGDPARDLSVRFHDRVAATPFGPAAGPQSQLAQNIVLSWLVGGRIIELKTVQILDELDIPRPCIDMQTVGFNVEWSQELKLEQSLGEYVKAAMLVAMLEASGALPLAPGFGRTVYDMSVGYDLAGIQTERVQAFIDGMMDAGAQVDALRREIPAAFRHLRDLDFPRHLSGTLTLSTFHGCPPDEIEKIIAWLMEEKRLHCVVKLNPTLLGPARARELLNDALGYEEIRIPDSAFEKDTRWEQAVDFVGRLGDRAAALGLGFGVKFSNTLIVENHRGFFPESEKEMYLSGQPLHVLAMNLVQRFRDTFGDRFPISFSAGIERANFPDAVALGLVPITVCSDLLRPNGYGRAHGYFAELHRRMERAGATDVESFIIRARGQGEAALRRLGLDGGDPRLAACLEALGTPGADLRAAAGDAALFDRWVSEARLLNTRDYVPAATADPRYVAAKNRKVPRKIGSALVLFDCITCDKCVPVCPNDANFTLPIPPGELPVLKLRRAGAGWEAREAGTLALTRKHQIANFADFCNECGNCDVFCPEDGGPYVVKPRFFGSLDDFRAFARHDGFHLAREGGREVVHGRIDGRAYVVTLEGGRVAYEGEGFAVRFDPADPAGTAEGEAAGEVDLTPYLIMDAIRRAVAEAGPGTYPGALLAPPA